MGCQNRSRTNVEHESCREIKRDLVLQFFQKIFFKFLSKLQYGEITIIDDGETYCFSSPNNLFNHSIITIHNKKCYQKILLNGSNGAAESYINGDWDVDNLESLLEIILKNREVLKDFDVGFPKLSNLITKILNYFSYNSKKKAKKNILAHYDLGNEFFQSFLDPTMLYSSAIYPNNAADLHEASLNKLKIICELLQLKKTDHLLEIGTGWGGMAIYAAQNYGCKVTTTTISEKQFAYVENKIAKLGLKDQITLLNKDYRDLKGQYDKLVSIEMIEAVGYQQYDIYFKQCSALLKPNGLFLLQSIVINDDSYEAAKNSVDFIKKYIFPGGCLPSMHIIETIAKNSCLNLIYKNDIGQHYVKTLRDWLKNFNKNIAFIRSLEYSEKFLRMWQYYLSYCAAGFNQSYIMDMHCLWNKK